MDNQTAAFIIVIIVGLLMAVYPNFVLFKPSRKGQWIYNLIGEKNWTLLIRAFGIMFAIISVFFIASGL